MDYDDYRKENKPVFSANDMGEATTAAYVRGKERGINDAKKIIKGLVIQFEDADRLCMSTDHLLDLIDEALA